MRRAQVVIYEADGRLAEGLREAAQKHGWWLRQVRQVQAALDALGKGGFGVLVLKVGRNLPWQLPEVATIVVSDADNSALADLAWDLGARLVLLPPLPRAYLAQVIASLLTDRTSRGAADEPTT